jgi:hypothetical protein
VPVWPNGAYPYRVMFEFVTTLDDIGGADMPPTALDALRYSVIQRSQPALGPEPVIERGDRGTHTTRLRHQEPTQPTTRFPIGFSERWMTLMGSSVARSARSR